MQLPSDPALIRKQADTYETIALIMLGLAAVALWVLFPLTNTRYRHDVALPIFSMAWASVQLGVLARLTRWKANRVEAKARKSTS